jgi:C4-dicarboxylate-specific signal transduction histidine kinase
MADAARECEPSWDFGTSAEEYRRLIHYLPVALWQVDTRGASVAFDQLKADDVTDIAAYLDAHPELVEHAKDVVLVTAANREAVSLLRANSAADLIRPVRYLFSAVPDLAKRVMVAHFEGRRNYIEETKVAAFDGTLVDVHFTVTYATGSGHLEPSLLAMLDIGERLKTEARLRQLEADFTRAARISMLGEMATSIAHEVRQPLTAIVTNAETSLRWLERDDVSMAKLKQLTSRIISNGRRAGDIVQRISEMAAKHEPRQALLDLNEVVEEALLFVRHDIETWSIGLSVAYGARPPRVTGDRIQLQQVVVNLLVNSVQAIVQGSGSARRIDLCTGVDEDGAVVFSIRDTGPGIADENLERIFDSFFTTKDAGMGIGLAVCKSIVAAHGGRIAVSNHPAGGARFQFWLPTRPIACDAEPVVAQGSGSWITGHLGKPASG